MTDLKACRISAFVHAGDDYPLRVAAYKGYLPIVRLLVENGADIRNSNDKAYELAMKEHRSGVVNFFDSLLYERIKRQIRSVPERQPSPRSRSRVQSRSPNESSKRNRCQAITKNGDQCKRIAAGSDFCSTHGC